MPASQAPGSLASSQTTPTRRCTTRPQGRRSGNKRKARWTSWWQGPAQEGPSQVSGLGPVVQQRVGARTHRYIPLSLSLRYKGH